MRRQQSAASEHVVWPAAHDRRAAQLQVQRAAIVFGEALTPARANAARLLVQGSAPVAERLAAISGQVPIERYQYDGDATTLTPVDELRRSGWMGIAIHGLEARVDDTLGSAALRGPGRPARATDDAALRA